MELELCRGCSAGVGSAAAWGVLRCAALEVPDKHWHGVDFSPATPLYNWQMVRFYAAVIVIKICPFSDCVTLCGRNFERFFNTCGSCYYIANNFRKSLRVECAAKAGTCRWRDYQIGLAPMSREFQGHPTQLHYTSLFDIGFGLQDVPDQAPSSVAGDKHDGGVHSSTRLLQSTISHSAGDFRLTASPRGSLSNLTATPLPTTNPLPHQVCDWLYRASFSRMEVTHFTGRLHHVV